jgi:hypothetical protein
MKRVPLVWLEAASILFAYGCSSGASATPDAAAPIGDAASSAPDAVMPISDAAVTGVTFLVDVTRGPVRQFQPPAEPVLVSAYIYGINAGLEGADTSVGLVSRRTRWGLVRQGGDAYSLWNWTSDQWNAGSDYCFFQTGEGVVAGAITGTGDTIPAAQAQGAAFLATVAIGDYVAGPANNEVHVCPVSGTFCDATTQSTRVNPNGFPFVNDMDAGDAGGTAYVPNVAAKPGGAYCTCTSACDGGCQPAASPVYQDEFVAYLKTEYGSGAPIFFSLDNEPNYWGLTHPELWPSTGALPCQMYTVTYDDIVNRDIQFGSAVKAAWPEAKVFGPVVAQDGIVYAHAYADPHLPTEFLDYYLQKMAAAGQPLLDVLDVHYYDNNGTPPPGPSQCVQSPRLLWDPGYTSLSAADTAKLDFGSMGKGGYFGTSSWYPRQIIPRLLGKIATAFPAGTGAPVLSISEYNGGCEADISGGVAQADMLGVFGREGVWAAAAWPLQSLSDNYLLAAFDLYRNYDGHGAVVGDTSAHATTSDPVDTSIYALAHSDAPGAVDLVAINKTTAPVVASVAIAGGLALTGASAFQLVAGAAAVTAVPGSTPVTCNSATCTLSYTMPPMSATTLVVR